MKMARYGLVAALLSLWLAAAAGTRALQYEAIARYPDGCIVSVTVAPGYLPRAALVIENRRSETVYAWLEPRQGSGLERIDLGSLGAGERRSYAHLLPAGRNVLTARAGASGGLRQLFYVTNHGPGTCERRYVWPITYGSPRDG
jgi:hypothetical protein